MNDTMFPVLWQVGRSEEQRLREMGCPRYVPWGFVINYEGQAQSNHGQSLRQLAERGGLSPAELVFLVLRRKWRGLTAGMNAAFVPRLLELLNDYKTAREALSRPTDE